MLKTKYVGEQHNIRPVNWDEAWCRARSLYLSNFDNMYCR
jgi:hypothetical protein